MGQKKILLIENEQTLNKTLQIFFQQHHFHVSAVKNFNKEFPLLKQKIFDIIILDGSLTELKKIKSAFPFSFIFMISSSLNPQLIVDSIKNGAYDFLLKPFRLDDLLKKINLLFQPLSNLPLHEDYSIDAFIGKSRDIVKLKNYIHKIRNYSDTTILIEGDTGTGKGLLAKIIHYNSTRADMPFVEINCAALPENLLEAELFGYEPGAFTDAKTTKKGLFEIADNGTIFLDEIGDMSLSLQAKLLKIIEDKTIRRLGGVKSIHSNARIIAATNQNLTQKVADKQFRKDLFFRLNVLSFHIPSLKDREDDIFLLTDFLLTKFNIKFSKNIKELSSETKNIFKSYHWPGNVRELSNILEHIFILEDITVIKPEHLNFYDMSFSRNSQKEDLFSSFDLRLNEKNLIKKALQAAGGNQNQAAKILHISRDNLRYRIKKYNLNIDKNI